MWDSSEKCWVIPVDAVDACRDIMRGVYGRCDIQDIDSIKTVKLKLTFNEDFETLHSDVILFGKTLCHACGRDSGGKPGEDVVYLNGEPSSGGSVKNWCSVVPKGAVVMLSNVPEKFWREYIQSDNLTVEIVNEVPDKDKLLDERAKLITRVAEIDKILKTYKNKEVNTSLFFLFDSHKETLINPVSPLPPQGK